MPIMSIFSFFHNVSSILTHYHAIQSFNETCENIVGKGENGFFFTPSKTYFILHATYSLLSANAFKLNLSKILLLTLPNDQTLDSSRLQTFADHKIIATQNLNYAQRRVGNIVGKRWFLAFSPFPTFFQK